MKPRGQQQGKIETAENTSYDQGFSWRGNKTYLVVRQRRQFKKKQQGQVRFRREGYNSGFDGLWEAAGFKGETLSKKEAWRKAKRKEKRGPTKKKKMGPIAKGKP